MISQCSYNHPGPLIREVARLHASHAVCIMCTVYDITKYCIKYIANATSYIAIKQDCNGMLQYVVKYAASYIA